MSVGSITRFLSDCFIRRLFMFARVVSTIPNVVFSRVVLVRFSIFVRIGKAGP